MQLEEKLKFSDKRDTNWSRLLQPREKKNVLLPIKLRKGGKQVVGCLFRLPSDPTTKAKPPVQDERRKGGWEEKVARW